MLVDTTGSPVQVRNNVTVDGAATGRPVMLAHGFGCDQSMWSRVVPGFAPDYPVVLFDHVGAGG
ncbi:MAG: alpha/beta hydrolase, partial [Nakamurella sp.]